MFSALTQGSSIYLLDKTSSLDYKIGEVIGISSPKIIYNFGQGQSVVDLKVKVDDNIREFNNLPSINSIVSYNNGKVIISETKQGIQNEVESILQNRIDIINNFENYKQDKQDCEEILKKINPQFAKDKDLDDRLSGLETRIAGFESSINEILNHIKK